MKKNHSSKLIISALHVLDLSSFWPLKWLKITNTIIEFVVFNIGLILYIKIEKKIKKYTGWNKCMGDNINGYAKWSSRKLLDNSFVSSPTIGSQCEQAKLCWYFNRRSHCLIIIRGEPNRDYKEPNPNSNILSLVFVSYNRI